MHSCKFMWLPAHIISRAQSFSATSGSFLLCRVYAGYSSYKTCGLENMFPLYSVSVN